MKVLLRIRKAHPQCNSPDTMMGFWDPCGVCEACTADARRAAIEQMVGTALIQNNTLDEWELRRRAAEFYNKGRVRTPQRPVVLEESA